MMQTFSAFFDEFGDGGIRRHRLQKLDACRQHGDVNFLVLHGLAASRHAELLCVELQGGVDGFYRDAQMIDLVIK